MAGVCQRPAAETPGPQDIILTSPQLRLKTFTFKHVTIHFHQPADAESQIGTVQTTMSLK